MKKNGNNFLLNSYLFLLIFNIFNRECNIIIDTRYIILAFCALLLFKYILKSKMNKLKCDKKENNGYSKIFSEIVMFYIVIGLSFIPIFISEIYLDSVVFKNLVILNIFNLVNLFVLYFYRNEINKDKVIKYIKISFIVLGLSMIYSFIFHKIPFSNSNTGISLGSNQFNLLGKNYRLGGFLLDANYVTTLSICLIGFLRLFVKKSRERLFYIILCLIYIVFSFSKTVLLMLPFIFVICLIIKKIKTKREKRAFIKIIFLVIMCLPYILLKTNFMGNMVTMRLRYDMWRVGFDAFFNHPILGNGLSTFRSFMLLKNNWYVQCHSTIVQILCEHGIIALVLFFKIYYDILSDGNSKLSFIYFVFLSLSISYETLYLNFIILFFGIIPILYLNEKEDSYE